ncbi:MAG: peptide ABC transporter substrate-binding protein [Phycisphaerales bacterium]
MRIVIIVFALLIAGLAATVVSDRGSGPAELTYIEVFDLNTLDPQRMSYLQDNRVCYAVYEALLRWNNESPDFEPEPAIATHWDTSPDKLVYTFHLRPEARWSNGDPVTAHDFAYSWQRGMLPDTAADYAQMYFVIKGAEDYFNWRVEQTDAYSRLTDAERIAMFDLGSATDESGRALSQTAKLRRAAEALREQSNQRFRDTVGIEIVDDHTIRVTLAQPTPYFLDLMCYSPFHPVHEPTVERFVTIDPQTGVIRQDHGWTKPGQIVSNGPYIVANWEFRREVRMERNPHYWRPEAVKSDSVKLIPIDDPNTAVLAFKSGAADWLADVTADYTGDMLELKAQGGLDSIHAFSTFGTYFWSFNCNPRFNDGRPNPLSDARVRRALAYGLDKERLCNDIRRSGERAAYVLIPPGSLPGFESPEGLRFDPAKARSELASAGWQDRDGDGIPENENGEPFPAIELLCSSGSYHVTIAQAMAAMWEQTLGIRCQIVVKETKVYRDNLKKQDYHMARGGWYGDYADPTTFHNLHKTGDGNNDRNFSDPYFDELLDKAARTLDDEQRTDLYEEAERYVMEEALPILPIWHYNEYYMYHPPTKPDGSPNPGGLRGLSSHPRLVQYLWKLEVVE